MAEFTKEASGLAARLASAWACTRAGVAMLTASATAALICSFCAEVSSAGNSPGCMGGGVSVGVCPDSW